MEKDEMKQSYPNPLKLPPFGERSGRRRLVITTKHLN